MEALSHYEAVVVSNGFIDHFRSVLIFTHSSKIVNMSKKIDLLFIEDSCLYGLFLSSSLKLQSTKL